MAENIKNQYIEIKGARVHNLKNIDLQIPRNKMVVITGLSGSGKSSLAFDTLYAEGQRRYVESLSSYARQFLGRMDKPDVDYIKGIPPAIAIEQKVNTRNPRSTVGTSTEIYDYIKLLYARIGHTYSPISGKEVIRHEVSDVVNAIFSFPEGTKVILLAPFLTNKERTLAQEADLLQQQGFTRLEISGEVIRIADLDPSLSAKKKVKEISIVIDRFAVSDDEDLLSRAADSIQTAFYEGKGECIVRMITPEGTTLHHFSNRFEADGITFEEPSLHMFSFNNPIGACPLCEGYGKTIGIDEDLVIPNKSLSIFNEAIVCWKGEKMSEWKDQLVMNSDKFNFPIHKAYYDLSPDQKRLLWTGNQYFEGLNSFFKSLEEQSYKIQYRVMLSRYRGKTICPVCEGTRLKKEASYVRIGGKAVSELVNQPVDQLAFFFKGL
jgi:excinuclease ABC subunit A